MDHSKNAVLERRNKVDSLLHKGINNESAMTLLRNMGFNKSAANDALKHWRKRHGEYKALTKDQKAILHGNESNVTIVFPHEIMERPATIVEKTKKGYKHHRKSDRAR